MRQFEWLWLYGSVWVSALHIGLLVGVGITGHMGPPRFRMENGTQSYQRHHVLNDIISRAVSSAKVPDTSKEPSDLFRSDGKRPDGLTLLLYIDTLAKRFLPHGTVVATLADS